MSITHTRDLVAAVNTQLLALNARIVFLDRKANHSDGYKGRQAARVKLARLHQLVGALTAAAGGNHVNLMLREPLTDRERLTLQLIRDLSQR